MPSKFFYLHPSQSLILCCINNTSNNLNKKSTHFSFFSNCCNHCKGQGERRLLPFTLTTNKRVLANIFFIPLNQKSNKRKKRKKKKKKNNNNKSSNNNYNISIMALLHFLQQQQKNQKRHAIYHPPPMTKLFVLLTLSFHCLSTISYAAPRHDPVEPLLKLKQSFTNATALITWDRANRPCVGPKAIWAGLICSNGGSVYGLRLENMGLTGKIDVEALNELPKVRTISFKGNGFTGPLPIVNQMKTLKAMYFSSNAFDGPVDPKAFDGLNRIKKIHIDNNKLSGPIPASLTMLPKLVELRLDGNQFQGQIPELAAIHSFVEFNVSNNQLEGPIPEGLSHMSPDSFAGNKGLCGMPINPCPVPSDHDQKNTPPTPEHKKTGSILIYIIIAIAALILLGLVICALCRRKKPKSQRPRPVPSAAAPARKTKDMENPDEGSVKSTSSTRNKGEGRLCFVREGGERFDLPDLLKASAEILGSGSFGSSYKASLVSGKAMVVKRFKQMNGVGREDFQEHMKRLGRLEHKNLLPLVAYYYRKEEKLLVADFVQKGSLAALLHGSRGQPTLDWPTRLKVIKGVARGVQYLYKELPMLTAPHGHLKSSNVLLDETFNPILNDYGLVPLINPGSAKDLMVAFKSPECINNGKINKKSDVWSLGILIIETLTGEFPANNLQRGSEVDLTSWVKAVVGEGESDINNDVFDSNMNATKNSEGEMQKLLKIGLACCESNVDKRLDVREACDRIEEVKERDNEDDYYTSYEGDRRSSRGLSDEFTVIVN